MASTKRINTPTEQNKEDNTLVLYRLELVEKAVNGLGEKFDHQDNIKKADLIEFRDAILERFNEKNAEFKTKLEELEKTKLDVTTYNDFKKLVWAVFALGGAVLTGVITYYLTTGAK